MGAVLLAQSPEARARAARWNPCCWPPGWPGSRRPARGTHRDAGLLLTDGSEPMASVLRELERVAGLGPAGADPRRHGHGQRARRAGNSTSGRAAPGALVAVNCSAFAEGLLESELFGHVKGAFTGADRDRRGAIEAARGGTLFLDEVADLSPRLQSLLLRVLQEREIRRVGSDQSIRVDVRFAAATHRPLEELAEAGAFRRDLLFRLQGAVLRLPPLVRPPPRVPLPGAPAGGEGRGGRQAARARPGTRPPPGPRPPGLARERARAAARAGTRHPALRRRHPEVHARAGAGGPPALQARAWDDATRAFQRRLLLDTLQACGFRMAEAAQTLGLARPALYATARRLGVDLVAERSRSGA